MAQQEQLQAPIVDGRAYKEGWALAWWTGILGVILFVGVLASGFVDGLLPVVGILGVGWLVLLLISLWKLSTAYSDRGLFWIMVEAVVMGVLGVVIVVAVAVAVEKAVIFAFSAGEEVTLSVGQVVDLLSRLGLWGLIVGIWVFVVPFMQREVWWRLGRYTSQWLFKVGAVLIWSVLGAIIGVVLVCLGLIVEGLRRRKELVA